MKKEEIYQLLSERMLVSKFARWAGISRGMAKNIFFHTYDIGWRERNAEVLRTLAEKFLNDPTQPHNKKTA